jgi:hypothetical protein
MSHIVHQFLWNVRRRRTLLTLHAGLWFLVTWLAWALPATISLTDDLCFGLHVALLTMTGLLAFESGGADPAAGTDTFWRTRPPRWRAVWLGNVTFIMVALAGPVLICWAVNGLMLDLTAGQWRAGLAEPACIISGLTVLAALRSLARGWTATLVTLGVAAGFISAGTALLDHAGSEQMNSLTGWQQKYSVNDVVRNAHRDVLLLVACMVPAFAIVSMWAAALRTHITRRAIICATVWALLAPVSVWLLLREEFLTRLLLVVSKPEETTTPDERPLGVVKLRGVPEELEVQVLADDLIANPVDARTAMKMRDRPRLGLSWSGQSAPAWLTARGGQRLRQRFPATTRWYSDGTGEAEGLKFVLEQLASRQMHAPLEGSVAGNLVCPAEGFAVRLENGRSAAANGARLRVANIHPGSRNLEIECDLWQSRTVSEWDGKRMESLLVLHLPAVPAALVLNEEGGLPFRSLQCASRRVLLRVTMPDAEMACGIRFTRETLAGAELWYFAPAAKRLFIARPEKGAALLYPASGSE